MSNKNHSDACKIHYKSGSAAADFQVESKRK
jgi:hypothetical protein